MASRPKRHIVQTVTYAEEFPPSEQKKKRKASRVDKTLYDVEIVERDHKTKRVRIHYVGYDIKFDEWITGNKDVCPIVKLNKAYVPDEGSLISRQNLLCHAVVTSPRVTEDSNRPLIFSSAKQNISSSTEKSANNPKDVLSELNDIRIKNINKLIIGNLNINSYAGKFDQFRTIIKNNLDIVVITETKLDDSYPDSQFYIDGFSKPYRMDRNKHGGGV